MDRFILRLSTKEITLIASCIAILFAQEQILTFIPNFQFSTLLIFIYSRVFGFKKTTLIIVIHVLLDNIYMGSIGMPNIVIPMLIAWMIVPIMLNTVFRKINNPLTLAIIGYFFGHLYGLTFVPFQALLLDIDIKAYLIADIPFEIVMGISNFLTIMWFITPIEKVLNDQYSIYQKETKKYV